MRITRIQFDNFRQHRSLDIDLSGPQGEFAIIQGRNGAGKTNLLKGITWIITGKLALDEPKFVPESLISHTALLNAKFGEEILVLGSLELDLGAGGVAKIDREMRFIRAETGARQAGTDVVVNTMKATAAGYQREPDADLWIERYLPRRFSHYFLFDGEHLNRFFRETEAKYVEQAVLEIASIDQLSRMVDHLDSVSKDLIKAAAQGQGAEAEENASNYQDYVRRLDEAREKISELRLAGDEYQEKISEASARLGDVKSIEADMSRRNEFERQAESASERAADARNELESWVTRFGPSLWLGEALEGLGKAIQQAHDDNVLPPPFKADALRELLEREMCVCGRELSPKSDSCLHIEKVLADFKTLSEVGEVLSEIQVPLYGVTSNLKTSSAQVGAILGRMKAAEKDEKEATTQFEILKKKLAGSDDEQISALSRNLDKYQADFGKNQNEIGRLEGQAEYFITEIDKYKRRIENQVAADARAQAALVRAQFAQEALRVAQELYVNLSNQVREEVARNLDEEFQAMIWKKNFFQPVEVDEHYRVQVRNMQGFEVRESLSAGETACLAFAFSLTLSKVAGFYYPMVVDSPFGRLDSEVKQFVSDVLSRVLKSTADASGNQLIMLMTDGEYTESVSEVMASSNPQLFVLDFNQLTGETEVQKVGV